MRTSSCRRLAALAVLLAGGAASAALEVRWSADGRAALVIETVMNGAMATVVTTSALELSTGRRKEWRLESRSCMTGDSSARAAREADQCWRDQERRRADDDARREAWLRGHPVAASTPTESPAGAKLEHLVEGDSVRFRLTAPGRTVREATLAARREAGSSASPDGQWIVLWTADGDESSTWSLMPGLARLQLLDAGAGAAAMADVTRVVTSAGYAPAHADRASAPHARTEVFFAPGFEADARAVAVALKAGAPKAITWSTPFAITVAVANAAP